MAGHIDVLMNIFPGQIFLDVEDIAKCLKQSKGHIYNLSSEKKLPFQLQWGLGDKIQVSIIDMANYLDTNLKNKVAEKPESSVLAPLEGVKKPEAKKGGRPRKTNIQMLFQAQLQYQIIREEFFNSFDRLEGSLEELEFNPNEDIACETKFNELKDETSSLVSNTKRYMSMVFLDVTLPVKATKTTTKM